MKEELTQAEIPFAEQRLHAKNNKLLSQSMVVKDVDGALEARQQISSNTEDKALFVDDVGQEISAMISQAEQNNAP